MVDVQKLRKEYLLKSLNETEVDTNPLEQFRKWLSEAIELNIGEVNAMTLATSTFEGRPSARMVLLKDLSEKGFVFFTNYESRKADNILKNPYGALVFYWEAQERQIRIEGSIEKLSDADSDKYFELRPKKSKLGAWASPQSKPIPDRQYLEDLMEDFNEEFSEKEITRPANWGGYVLIPNLMEFWQGRANRLHDRIQYTIINGKWKTERLAP